jgi:ABC-type phosphate/phosphonate transport system substrate-binding protein
VVRVCSLVAGFVVLAAVAVPESGAQPPKDVPLPEVKIGLPKVLFKDVHDSLIQIAAKPFNDMIQKTVAMKGKLIIAEDYRVLAKQLKANQVDIAVFHGFEFAWIEKSDPNLIPLVVTLPNCGKVQACLVVNVESAAKEPKDLKGQCVCIPKGSKAHCQMFLDQIRDGLSDDCCCPMKYAGLTSEEALDEVVNKKCESALVDVSALLSYRADKPGSGSCLKVLKESELLPSAVVVCRKGALTIEQVQAVKDGLLNCTSTTPGKIFVTFWNLKGFGAVNEEYYELLSKCRKTYPASFKLTDQAFVALRDANVPDAVLAKLNPLKNKELSRGDLEKEITKVLNKDETKQFQDMVLIHAAYPALISTNK